MTSLARIRRVSTPGLEATADLVRLGEVCRLLRELPAEREAIIRQARDEGVPARILAATCGFKGVQRIHQILNGPTYRQSRRRGGQAHGSSNGDSGS